MTKQHRYTEIFRSLQGEGKYTGANSLWIRWFMCNLRCDGFGQTDPTDPNTYELPYKELDLTDIKTVEDLPVFDKGCDSGYAHAKRYRHLARVENAVTIVNHLTDNLRSARNPNGLFKHPASGQETHMCFTGGEPMMKHSQLAIIGVLTEFSKRNNAPLNITVETNGTQTLTADTEELIDLHYTSSHFGGLVSDNRGHPEWFWSVSPKLFSTSGEKASKAIKPEVVAQYADVSNHGQLKYVVNGSAESWKEVEEATKQFRDAGVDWDVYIMPVGATKESQESPEIAEICNEALKRGYNVSGRLHAYIYGNIIGT